MNEEDDPTLVVRSRGGDREAFEHLVVRYQKPVFNVALRMLHNRQDAMDVAQTTFLKAFEHLGDYDPAFRFYSWLYRIAINESLNVLAVRKRLAEPVAEAIDERPGPERVAEGDQALEAIESALMLIKPELRAVVALRHIANLSYEDMAQVLGLPEKTVKSRLHSARELLREHLLRCEVL
ncbi:MAG: sigma-70 family RNA polymerase sigma factor [Steroidobacteraceae bacterium]